MWCGASLCVPWQAAGSFGSGMLYAKLGRGILIYLASALTALLAPLLLVHACLAACQRRHGHADSGGGEGGGGSSSAAPPPLLARDAASAAADAAWAEAVTAPMAAAVGRRSLGCGASTSSTSDFAIAD